jgi:dienelactone hydrolase
LIRIAALFCFALVALHLPVSPAGAQTAAPTPQAAPQAAPDAALQEDVFFNARVGGRIFRLEGLITRPANATGRLPLALILHGKDFVSSDMEKVRPRGSARQAQDLADRGWLVVSFTRRGFGRSDGPFPALANCNTLKPGDQFDADADETLAVLDLLRQRPDVDPERIIAVGISAGGAAALALAARNPPGLRGIVNLSGGLNLASCVDKGNDALVEAVRGFAAKTKIPQLWIYADNDELFPLALVNRMHEAALGAGGNIRRLSIEKLEPSGHNVFGSNLGRRTWLTEMDRSLRSWTLPTFNPADVVPWMKVLEGASRNNLERYQADPGHKALVYSPAQKTFWWRYAVSSRADAIANARKDCEAKAKDCKVMLIGNVLQR